MKRKIEDLNLLDNFLFGSMVTRPEIGEKFVRLLLESIFNKEFGKLTIVPQKEYPGIDTNYHGARLDVYVEADSEENGLESASVYDVEPEQDDRKEMVQALPKRTRFYHAKIDATSLGSGETYKHLKNVIVVMIVPFDPFGKDRVVYTIRNMCQEEPGMPYDDGARTLFLYTKGTRGRSTKKLRELLHYMEDTTEANAVNPSLRKIHNMVKAIKLNKEVSLSYMKIFEREEMLREEGRDEGRAEGRMEEQKNTERERIRAEEAERKADTAIRNLDTAMKKIEELTNQIFQMEQKRNVISPPD
ncbi:MAG: Rpn family recombination-promoting nuclease/putative transposase [Lachnospiraceae bacterium]|nr:Rpn family recombination-promoting nuclease/putative transposase [Lachnospiraceae bacterium]